MRIPPSSTGALATNITDSITNLRRALEISVTMSKDQREARVVGPDPKETSEKFSQETSMVQTQQGVLVDALAQEAREHLTRIVGADAKELQVKVPELPPPAPPSICDPPGPAPEERPPAPKSEKEVKKMEKEKKKQEALLEAQKEAARRERALVRGRYAMGMDDPTAVDRLFIAAPDLGLKQAQIDSMLKASLARERQTNPKCPIARRVSAGFSRRRRASLYKIPPASLTDPPPASHPDRRPSACSATCAASARSLTSPTSSAPSATSRVTAAGTARSSTGSGVTSASADTRRTSSPATTRASTRRRWSTRPSTTTSPSTSASGTASGSSSASSPRTTTVVT